MHSSPVQRLDWIGPPTPISADALLDQADSLRAHCFDDWDGYLAGLASRPLPTALVLATPPPAEAAVFLDWFAQRGVLLATTSPVVRASASDAAWLAHLNLLITDLEPLAPIAPLHGSSLTCLGGGLPPPRTDRCHIEVGTAFLPVLRQHQRRLDAQQAIDHLTPAPAPAAPPAAHPTVSIASPRLGSRQRLGRLLRTLAAQPGVGPLLRWGWALLRSGDTRQLVAGLERQQTHHQHEYQALLERVHQQGAQLRQLQTEQQQQHQTLSEHTRQHAEQLQQQTEQLQQHAEQLQQQFAYLQQQRTDLQAYQQEASEQLAPLRAGLGQLHLPSGELPTLHAEPMPDLLRRARESVARENNPSLFADLDETDLRQLYLGELAGSERHAILRAQYQAYQPHLLPAHGPVLDVGCGMGDWLAYLKEQGESALGIDTNPYEIERCRQRGLAAECADGLDWLDTQRNTYALITLMQVIEHIPRAQLDPLLLALAKALRPGGRLLLETLNPAHPFALSLFYNDPTHQRPLPVEYLGFLAQIAGLVPEQVLYTYPIEVMASAPSLRSPHYINYGLLLRKP